MSKKSFWWIVKFIKINLKKHLKFTFSSKKQHIWEPFVNNSCPQVKTYYPEGWLESNENERITAIGNNLLANKIYCK